MIDDKRLESDRFPFELINSLSFSLSSAHAKNYKHLADKLGYNYRQIKIFEMAENPVSLLIDDYLTTTNPTKEALYKALIAIGRHDVASKVQREL